MGCTHYPVLSGAIKKVLGNGVTLINAGVATAEAVKDYLDNQGLLNNGEKIGDTDFFVSDKPDSFRRIASVLLDSDIDDGKVEQVNISSL